MCFYGDPTVVAPRPRGTSAETILIPMPKYSCILLKQAANLLPTYCTWMGVRVPESHLLPGQSAEGGTDLPSNAAPTRGDIYFIAKVLQLDRSRDSCQVSFASR